MCPHRGGFDCNPSAMLFRQNLRHRVQEALMKPPPSGNCEVDEDDIADVNINSVDLRKQEDVQRATDTENENDEPGRGNESLDNSEQDYHTSHDQAKEDAVDSCSGGVTQAMLQTCSVQYVAGYLVKVLADKFHCDKCVADLMIQGSSLDQPNELMILNKSYATKDSVSHLTAPSLDMVSVTHIVLDVFSEDFERIKHLPLEKHTIVQRARTSVKRLHKSWLMETDPCNQHREYIINYLLKLKITKTILWFSRNVRMSQARTSHMSEYSNKIKNLQHLELRY